MTVSDPAGAAAAVPGPGPGAPPLAGRFVLEERIGAGASGAVWRARDLRTGRPVAAKVLHDRPGAPIPLRAAPSGAVPETESLLRFVREQALRVRHPHVLAPTGWAAEDDVVVIAMDLVCGGSLQALVAEHGPLPEDFVAVLLDQLLSALAAVHEAGLVHRDVKPANLLLVPTGTGRPHLRLGDFGVAATLHEVRATRLAGVVGTDGYIPPEQLPGADPDPRADLYAAGVVAVQLLTGVAPPACGPLGPVPPGRLAPVLSALVDPDVRRRPASADAALDLLRAVGVPTGAPWQHRPHPPDVRDRVGPGPTGRVGPAARRRPAPRPGSGRAHVASARTVACVCFLLAIGLCLAALTLLLA